MSVREIHEEKATAREMFVKPAPYANPAASPASLHGNSIKSRQDNALASAASDAFYQPASSLPLTRIDAANLIRILRQLELTARKQPPRIAFKSKGKILFLDLAEIVAVQAEGNYVSLRHPSSPYLLRESLSSMAEKLKPYNFIRIHRSVLVNISAVEQIQPLPTGEYRLRLRGGKDYLVTRTYKDNLKNLAQLWVGSERLFTAA